MYNIKYMFEQRYLIAFAEKKTLEKIVKCKLLSMQTSKWASKCTVERARMGAQPTLNYQWKSANVRTKLWLFILMLPEDSKCMDWYNLLQFRYDDRTSEKRKHSTEECCSDLMNGLVLRCTTASCDARGQNSLDWRRSFSQVYLLRFWTPSAVGLAFISTSSSISSPDWVQHGFNREWLEA